MPAVLGLRTCLAAWLAVVSAAVAGCAGGDGPNAAAERRWTTQQAESITSVRGLPVRVRRCRGLGPAQNGESEPRFRRFRCLAGGRATSDRYAFDTVAVRYDLHPTAEYRGPGSGHRLTNVRFVGGPGIP
jgi:hypothetical protein